MKIATKFVIIILLSQNLHLLYKHTHFWASGPQPRKEIEITANKTTAFCLTNTKFYLDCVFKKSQIVSYMHKTMRLRQHRGFYSDICLNADAD